MKPMDVDRLPQDRPHSIRQMHHMRLATYHLPFAGIFHDIYHKTSTKRQMQRPATRPILRPQTFTLPPNAFEHISAATRST